MKATGNDSTKGGNNTQSKNKKEFLLQLLTMLMPPVLVMCIMLYVFHKYDMYPFGTKSLSWCDMSQQVIPLLNQFKDILDGKSSFFLNFKDSGGMNFYGVFFFFLASPFSFLVKFIEKSEMMMFANVLVALKMSVCAFTSSLCLCACRKRLDKSSIVLLSVMYPFCGFTMMYYQNIIWLDMMYLFPLLVMSIYKLTKKQNCIMYTAVLSAMMTVNYYICYMVVVFILLFTLVYVLKNRKSEYCGRVCREIFIGSFISALLTAVVWMPSLIQYFGSGRGETTLVDSISDSSFAASYQTIMPMLFCLAFVIVVVIADIAAGRKRSERNNRMLIVLGLTLVPFFVEPINKMWHTGNYMSFPCRFGFMTIFLAIFCVAYSLEENIKSEAKISKYLFGAICSMFAILFCAVFISKTMEQNSENLSKYAYSLWGNDTSFKLLFGEFIMFALAYGVVYFFYKKGFIFKNVFLGLTAVVFLIESTNYAKVYMANPAEHNKDTNTNQSLIYDLEDKVEDDSFYRMKSVSKVYNNNMIGALGYNSISHYTSLNNRDYMFTMKRLGYSGVWMETSSVGGTLLTDALLSIKYEINGNETGSEMIYRSDNIGAIYSLPYYLPMGLLLDDGSLDGCEEIPEEYTRTEVQEYLSESIFGENIITACEPEQKITYKNGKYEMKNGDKITYTVNVKGNGAVYLDCFDELTNHLSEPIFESMSVRANGRQVSASYPVGTENGVLLLGEFTDETVEVEITLKEDVSCASFGVFVLDSDRLSELCNEAEGVNLTEDGSGLSGKCTTDEAKTCFVSVPYDDGFTVKINGKKVSYSKALSDFISFEVPAGENEIEISYLPSGFVPGVIISIVGAAVFVIFIIFRKKLDKSMRCDSVLKYVMLVVSAAAAIAVYVMPLVIYVMNMGTE